MEIDGIVVAVGVIIDAKYWRMGEIGVVLCIAGSTIIMIEGIIIILVVSVGRTRMINNLRCRKPTLLLSTSTVIVRSIQVAIISCVGSLLLLMMIVVMNIVASSIMIVMIVAMNTVVVM